MSTNPPSTTITPATTGITVSPEIWNQMQAMLAMFQAQQSTTTTQLQLPKTTPATPSEPICTSLTDTPPKEPNPPSFNQNDPFDALNEDLPDDVFGLAPVGSEADDPNTVILTPHEDNPTPKAPPACMNPGQGPLDMTDIEAYDYSHGEKLDPPPVSVTFVSKDALFAFCQNWAKVRGYAVATGHSARGKNVYIQCDRSGEYRGVVPSISGRNTSTMKVECPFLLYGATSTSQKVTNKSWRLEIRHGDHNHEPSPVASAHAAHRLLQPGQLKEVGRLRKSNLKPAQILLQLRTADPNTLATNRTISNALQKQRREELDGKTPIEALLCILKETNWSWDAKYTATGAVQNLFFAHPGSIHLARIYHHVALLDATYKTNSSKIPLLHIIGQTATNRSFSIAFCFLTYKDDENYLWAVNILKNIIWRAERIPKVFVTDRDAALRKALALVFPDSQANLCTWHLNTNIATNCKKALGEGWNDFIKKWNNVTYSKTPEIFVERWNELKTHLAPLPTVLHYIETSIIPVKELFVVAWACQHPHLRNLNTSRVESGHTFIKTFIKNSTGDFLTVFQSLALAVDTQLNAAHEAIGKDTMKALVNVPKCFIPLLCRVSTFAIKQCKTQFDRLKNLDPTEPCSQTVTIGLGIPCAHRIAEILEAGDELSPEDFHKQWHLRYNPESHQSEDTELDVDAELHKLMASIAHEQPSHLEKVFLQLNQVVSGSHVAVPIQGPGVKKNPKGRPTTISKRQAASTSTKRNPSAHEIVDADLKKTKPKPTKKRVAAPAAGATGGKSKRLRKEPEDPNDEDDTGDLPDADDLIRAKGQDEYFPSQGVDWDQTADRVEAADQHSDNHSKEAIKPEDPLADQDVAINEENVEEVPSASYLAYIPQVPKHFSQFVKDIFNPRGDGNCGFRCVAQALGYADDMGFMQVRDEMAREIASWRSNYTKLQGGENEMKKIINSLTVARAKESVGCDKWLDKMLHGQILANTYNRPIIFLSQGDSNSFLPLRLGPKDSTRVEPIYLLYVDSNHWVLLEVGGIDGDKPLPPPIRAPKFATKAAKAWPTYVQKGLALYKQSLVSRSVEGKN
ncbi:hypothetical protein PSTG_11817 [Puccinia striiformis f. sp. tritici PST-78]|uniref:OTU domain-containing protein n=1 Tax=Puccinia striiformis f. sp. tritici PST-78 TaxID=1165861 RepID=A0A0L0V6J6_9BASI|nr:hypothetical protein PSTG_11817 [Puccinia striiformis f. sp. tritici PST-78]